MAQASSDSVHVVQLIHDLKTAVDSHPDILNDQEARTKLSYLSRELSTTLEPPDVTVSLVAWCGGYSACVRIADDLRIFDMLAERSPRNAEEFVTATGAEHLFVLRIMRALVGMGFARQVGRENYSETQASHQMTLPSVRAGIRWAHDQALDTYHVMPEFFKKNGYKCPTTGTDTPFQYLHNTEEPAYVYWSKQPGVIENFNTFMGGLYGTPLRLPWQDWFPVNRVVFDGYQEHVSDVSFVDVGGGLGHECQTLLKKFPNVKGRIVLEDLPHVIDDVKELDPRIETFPMDFLKGQPIKGARAYLFQNIFHNWADSVCLEILENLAPAMKPGYSKLLISNIIIKDENAPLRHAGIDIAMFMFSGLQRTETQWKELLDKGGFKVVKFWHPPGDADGMVEAEVKLGD
ncbi:S-adenosyl-L-methionine-dependent methyltransferase [Viridothelium virens]|uniref:S-adenosyl-L-methionine-dependent methyltransferase n=1 Tax=Viridothelium virens TaxID=1048519 RepID=A0A6A6HCY8_VIRVR|nr:S-adenosyl-L-methionine-dependent methyltransferase [Viridothelium virens]